ncbi:hypothetical protein CCACVL1_15431 [Corchorus capsularis]|uniref:Uncharacterized protein n=1 Tax=Corchorus capsularis TaxID=210143 RepID=A0A1R3I2F4_COCAP|nr:hypothetical protein CCACVL1_15431 [Corchorus capsularis]
MSSQNQGASLSSSVDPPMKRKRGRPRKDENVQGDSTSLTPASDSLKKNKQTMGISNPASDEMATPILISEVWYFVPGRFTPITAANDVAPHAKMYTRKEIPIPFVNSQSQLHSVGPPSGKNEKPVEHKNDAPNLPDQSLHTGLQSGATAASESQSASIPIPLATNLPINDPGLPLVQKVLQEQIIDSGLQNDKAIGVHQSLQGFEAFKLMKGPNIDLETPKASEPVSVTLTATLPVTETVNLKPQVENQGMISGLKPQELVHDGVKCIDLCNNQSLTFPEPKPQPQVMASKPTGINMFDKQTFSRQEIDISQDTQLELAKKILSGDNTPRMDGFTTGDAATATVTAPCSASMTSLPIMIFGAETIPCEPKPATEESLFPRMAAPEVSSSSIAANTISVECNAKDAIPPAQS